MGTQQRKYFIPMEVSSETIKDYSINPKEVSWQKIGNRKVLCHLVEVSEEVYYEYMRPLWREDKQRQRNTHPNMSLDVLQEECGMEFIDDSFNVEQAVIDKEIHQVLHELLSALEGIDRVIVTQLAEGESYTAIGKKVGLSPNGVKKRANKNLQHLRKSLTGNGF